MPEQWEKVNIKVQRPLIPPDSNTHCGNSIQSGDEQSISLPPGSRYRHRLLSEGHKVYAHALSLCVCVIVFQTCTAAAAGVFGERIELHRASHSATVLVCHSHAESIHTHRLRKIQPHTHTHKDTCKVLSTLQIIQTPCFYYSILLCFNYLCSALSVCL